MSSPLPSEPAHPLDVVDPVPPGSWPDQPASQAEDVPTAEPKPLNNRGTGRPHRGRYRPRNPNYRLSRDELRDFAALTLTRLDEGAYTPPHTEEPYDLAAKIDYSNENTGYYAPDDIDLENWTTADLGLPVDPESEKKTNILIREYSTLIGARRLRNLVDLLPETENKTVGVLNFASAKKPGGGFINGSQAQEESIARASTLYPSLISPVGVQFYAHYVEEPNNAYYTHAMIYSPSIVLFRNDIGHWMKPIEVDVLTSAAVNAGEVRDQVRQEEEMRLLRERIKEAEEKRRRKRERRRELEAELRKAEEEELEQALEESRKDGIASTEPTSDTAKAASADEMELEGPASPAALKHEKEATVQGTETESTVETTTIDAPVDSNSSDTWSTDTQDAESIVQTPTNEASGETKLLLETSADAQETEATPPPILDAALESEGTFIQLPPPEPEAQTEVQPDPSEPAPDPFYLAEVQIDVQMYERIGRLLYLFHKRGARHLVLGSFGTGVFQNRIELVAGIFYDLLAKPDARFKDAFDTVVFAILGGWTVKVFRDVFGDAAVERLEGEDEVDEEGSEVEGMKDVEGEDELDGGGDGEVLGTAEAEETSVEVQMEGKESVEVQTEAEETVGNAEEIPSTEPTQEIGKPIGESDDVEMIDLTEKPVVDPQPYQAEPTASQNEQNPPSVHKPQIQSQA
ncbi:hypothetical protein GALMADRAFT_519530 [Galerina marginata CBS 339.88]|uniref:Microbial-type PARG catalytic domain-containing protein n=1 Tax=Galerina marginata (strain CBS 339.88) TaxID=685588 RepID=A0A067SVQ1_GALM3|nr:hypothetical protein GALMADRAFT_519530 [Galerina marginata CBS 339.88]